MVCFGGEANTSGLGALDVAYRIFGSSYMGRRWIECMLGEDGCDGGEVGPGGVGQPEEGANKALHLLFEVDRGDI